MDMALRDQIQRIVVTTNRNYGYRRVTKQLSNLGWVVNHKRVLRLMKQDNLLCLRRKAFVPTTTNSRHQWRVWPNLARGIETTGINQLWVADITYIRLSEQFVFLAIVLDAHSRRVVGWSLDVELNARVAIDALDMAIRSRASTSRYDSSFRSRCAVCLFGLHDTIASPRHPNQHEPHWQPL